MTPEFEKLKNRNNELAHLISNNEEDHTLKRELYQNKLRMLDIIHEDDRAVAGMNTHEFFNYVESLPNKPKYETRFRLLNDKFNGGFETGMFIQLAGESGVGKSKLLIDLVTDFSKGHKCVFFNMEMGSRLLYRKLKEKNLSDIQKKNLNIDIQTKDLDDLVMEIELYAKDGYSFFMIDSKMKIEVKGSEPTHEKISRLSNTLAKLCQKRDIAIFLINQTSEQDLKDKRLSLKGSGDQKYDSDIVFFYLKDDKTQERTLMCVKNRQSERLFDMKIHLDQNGESTDMNVEVVEYKPNNAPVSDKIDMGSVL